MAVMNPHASDRIRAWLPDDAVIDIVARPEGPEPAGWSAQIPAFRISGHGESREDAVSRARAQLLSYFEQASAQGQSYEAAMRSFVRLLGLLFVVALALTIARHKNASWWRVPGDMLLTDDWEAARESIEILDDEETMTALRESDEDFAAGRMRPYEEIRRELGLG